MALLVPILTVLTPAWAGEDGAEFRKDSYPPLTLAKAVKQSPCRPAAPYEVVDRMFSAEIVYQGAVRESSKTRRELVRRWARKLGDPGAAVRYGSEISLSEGEDVHWLPVPDGLLPVLESDLQPGDRAMAYLVFVGCAANQPVFTLDEFEALEASSDEQGDVVVRGPSAQRRIS